MLASVLKLCLCRCHAIVARHSQSVDTDSKVCAQCRGQLTYLGKFDAQGNAEPERQLTPYNRFVQQRYSDVQVRCCWAVLRGWGEACSLTVQQHDAKQSPEPGAVQREMGQGTPGKAVMRRLSVEWREHKSAAKQGAEQGRAGPAAPSRLSSVSRPLAALAEGLDSMADQLAGDVQRQLAL